MINSVTSILATIIIIAWKPRREISAPTLFGPTFYGDSLLHFVGPQFMETSLLSIRSIKHRELVALAVYLPEAYSHIQLPQVEEIFSRKNLMQPAISRIKQACDLWRSSSALINKTG